MSSLEDEFIDGILDSFAKLCAADEVSAQTIMLALVMSHDVILRSVGLIDSDEGSKALAADLIKYYRDRLK